MSNPKSQVSDSSTSLLSETPDLKKWFSSYTYQSPELDTNEHFFCLSAEVVNDDDKGLCVHDHDSEKEGKCEDFAQINQSIICKSTKEVQKHDSPSPTDVEVPNYSDSLSLPSGPPDITKWFPSYVYESPELDSADFDISLISNYSSREDHHLEEWPVTKGKIETLNCVEETATHSQVKNNKNFSTIHEDGSESTLSPENILFPGTTFDQKISRADPNICNAINPDKPDVCARVRAEDLFPKFQENIDPIWSPAKKLRPAENDQCWISLDRKQKKGDCRNIKKEQEQHIPVQNQFISIKNKARPMINKENSPANSVCSYDEQKGLMLRREVLKERTNSDLPVPEVAGKWRCPQKNKPHTGPPLKQLRLERWIHKR